MRHGGHKNPETTTDIPIIEGVKVIKGEALGCYFCSDVTAPGNVKQTKSVSNIRLCNILICSLWKTVV